MPQVVSSNLFTSPLSTQLPLGLVGLNAVAFTRTVVDADVDEIGDVTRLVPLAAGDVPYLLYIENATDLDTGTNLLRTDIVLVDSAGANPNVLVTDASGFFIAAHSTGAGQWLLLNTAPNPAAANRAVDGGALAFRVTAARNAAATSGAVRGVLFYMSG